ncbi:MAG: hypothetical protein LBV68_04175, partial [Spirochaetaceae bacterium]|nr:hypothetical protein [Spirochaetaceae bacterium]
MDDFELLTTILSALKWRQLNGNIKMITDEAGALYYQKLGIEHIWDLGIDTTLDKFRDYAIDPAIFWAAGKILALGEQKIPVAMLDTDFVAWVNLEEKLEKTKLAVIHREDIDAKIYPGVEYFNLTGNYTLPEWDWTVLPCNTAFLYINDENLKEYYTEQAINFMKITPAVFDPLTFMVFAEQRLLAMSAQ